MRDSLGRGGQVCGSGISFLDDFVGPRFIGTMFIGRAIIGGDFISTKFIPAEFRGTESNSESSAQNHRP
jgi:hypothetical protein